MTASDTRGSSVINFCPTGMIPTKTMTPHVPVSPTEIIEQTHEAYELGITIAHLHARDDDGLPTSAPEVYNKIVRGLRKHCPKLVLCLSTSGRNTPEFEKRSAVIELQPDMCSLTLGSLNFVQQASVNSPEMIVRLAEKMKRYGVKPELECFNLGMINYGKYLLKKGILEGPCYWNLLFGNINGYQSDISHIAAALRDIPKGHQVALGGLGHQQATTVATAVIHGYGVRIGLEDNIYRDSYKKILGTNMDQVKMIHKLLDLTQRTWMRPEEFGNLGFYNCNRQTK